MTLIRTLLTALAMGGAVQAQTAIQHDICYYNAAVNGEGSESCDQFFLADISVIERNPIALQSMARDLNRYTGRALRGIVGYSDEARGTYEVVMRPYLENSYNQCLHQRQAAGDTQPAATALCDVVYQFWLYQTFVSQFAEAWVATRDTP